MAIAEDDLDAPGVASDITQPGRLVVLGLADFLDEESEKTLDIYEVLAAALVGAPAAYVALVAGDEEWSPGAVEVDPAQEPVGMLTSTGPIRQRPLTSDEPLVIDDIDCDSRTEHTIRQMDSGIASYASVPLRISTGELVGSLYVVDRRPRSWPDQQLALLRDLGALVSRDLEHRLVAWRFGAVHGLGQRVGHEVQVLLDAVSGLVDRAEQQDDPQLQRHAARVRAGSRGVGALVTELEAATGWQHQPLPSDPRSVDLRRAVERAATFVRNRTGRHRVELELPAEAPRIRCDAVRLERALVHLFVAAVHHSTEGEPLRVEVAVPVPDRAALALDMIGPKVPAAVLGRIVARFSAGLGEQPAGEAGPVALRMFGGTLHAVSGPVSARSTSHGLSLRAEWELQPDPDPAVIDLR